MRLLYAILLLDLCLPFWAQGEISIATEPVVYINLPSTNEVYEVQLNDDLVNGEWKVMAEVHPATTNEKYKVILMFEVPDKLYYRLKGGSFAYPPEPLNVSTNGGSTNAPPPCP